MRKHESAVMAACRATARLAVAVGAVGLGGTPGVLAAEPPAAPVEGWHSPSLGLRLLPPAGWAVGPGPSADSVLMQPRRGKGQISLLSLPLEGRTAEPGVGDLVDAALASLKQRVTGFKLLERREAGVAKLPAEEIYFRGKVEGEKYRWVQTIFVRGSNQVVLMYTAPDETFSRFLGDYDQVVRSVRILP
jgi:hypothetical protein